jgi:predicted phosphate transport protein (TIGR00153 family)
MAFALFARETRFFDLFNEAAGRISAAAQKFLDMFVSFDDLAERAVAMKAEEEACDGIARKTIEVLDRSFITPFDREDIHTLVTSLDEVMDNIEETAHRVAVARTGRPTAEAVEMARIVTAACDHLEKAVQELRDLRRPDRIQGHVREIGRLENEADRIYRQVDADLFARPQADIRDMIKWRELYACLEETVDSTKNVANIISGIVIKNA